MNHSDSERIASVLESAGYKATPKINGADLVVVNMCSVRQSAVDRVFGVGQKLVKLKTLNPKPKTVLTGCILAKDKKRLAGSFDFILDIKYLQKWPKILDSSTPVLFSGRELLEESDYLKTQPKYSNNFSALVPIMTGCNNFCAFCVVPYVKGREISRPAKEIICEVENLVKRGFKEIWLLGQNVNSYKGENGINFPKLLEMVNDIPGNFWIRFTSSHPKPSTRAKLGAGLVPHRNKVSGAGDFSWDELIKAMAECEKVTEYLNLPIQAGDNAILKKMNRPYTVAHYKNLIKKIRKQIPDITLSTDVIAGFPSETEKQFQNTVKVFKEIKFDMAYIAEYSPRAQTAAAKLEDDVPKKEKKRRWIILNEILKKTALEKNKKYIGKEVEALIDTKKSTNEWVGKTRSYKTIFINSKKNLLGKSIRTKIVSASPWGLKGKLL